MVLFGSQLDRMGLYGSNLDQLGQSGSRLDRMGISLFKLDQLSLYRSKLDHKGPSWSLLIPFDLTLLWVQRRTWGQILSLGVIWIVKRMKKLKSHIASDIWIRYGSYGEIIKLVCLNKELKYDTSWHPMTLIAIHYTSSHDFDLSCAIRRSLGL